MQAAEAGGADSGLLADGEGRRQLEKVVQVRCWHCLHQDCCICTACYCSSCCDSCCPC